MPLPQPQSHQTISTPERFVLLDILRGLAAFAVVLFHWKHFMFAPGAESASAAALQTQPFYDAFRMIYEQGFRAVDLFFCLSGFIFYRFYAQVIAGGGMDARRFTVLRFSRLYPLHFATLCLVIVLQGLYVAQTGAMFVYQHNDLWHLALQLLFMQNWGFAAGDSFNGPGWSVSVEVLLYLIFFALCQRGLAGWRTTIVMVLMGLVLHRYNPMVARGIIGFFMGGLMTFAYSATLAAPSAARQKVLAATLAVVLPGIAMIFAVPESWFYQAVVAPAASLADGKGRFVLSSLAALVLFPATVLALALLEPYYGRSLEKLAWFGNVTYSSYLLHFPLQLLIVLLVAATGWHFDPSSPAALLSFFVVLGVLSLVVHARFELPLQATLRDSLLPRPRKPTLNRRALPSQASSRSRRKSRAEP